MEALRDICEQIFLIWVLNWNFQTSMQNLCLVSVFAQSNLFLSGEKMLLISTNSEAWSLCDGHHVCSSWPHLYFLIRFCSHSVFFTPHNLNESNLISGKVHPGQAECPWPLPEGGHSDRESGDGDGASVSDWGWRPASDRRQAHPGDPPQRRH